MNWLKKNKGKLIAALLVLAVLTGSFFLGGDGGESGGFESEPGGQQEQGPDASLPSGGEGTAPDSGGESEAPPVSDQDPGGETTAGQEPQDPPTDPGTDDGQLRCTISVSCKTMLDNLDEIDKDKWELIPADGVILSPVEVVFYEGESVFNVLQRTMKQQKLHLEFSMTPIYNSAYIEGIGNIYEFEAGALSGWMYRVNDFFPNYGSSKHPVQNGDVIEWVFSCDLGKDVGGEYAAGQQGNG